MITTDIGVQELTTIRKGAYGPEKLIGLNISQENGKPFRMNDVYDFRAWLRNYYFANMGYYDDMMGKVSSVYDKFDCVESVNIDTSNLYIEILLNDNNRENISKVISYVSRTIQEYSINIIERFCEDSDKKDTFLKLANSVNLIFDLYTVGNSLKFAL